jgi:hypothetical protein
MFGFSRMGLGSEIVLRGTIRDVMKCCKGFRAVSMEISSNVAGNQCFGWRVLWGYI